MFTITIAQDGKVLQEVNARMYIASGIGETTEEGTSMHQMMVAEGAGEMDITRLLSSVVEIVYKATEDEVVADAIVALALAKAKMRRAVDSVQDEDEETISDVVEKPLKE